MVKIIQQMRRKCKDLLQTPRLLLVHRMEVVWQWSVIKLLQANSFKLAVACEEEYVVNSLWWNGEHERKTDTILTGKSMIHFQPVNLLFKHKM